MYRVQTLLVIGSEGFERLAPYLRGEGIRSVLISSFRSPTNLHLADVGYHLPGSDNAQDIVRIAIAEKAKWAVSASIPDDIVARDAEIKSVLEMTYGIPVAAQDLDVVSICNDKIRTRHFCQLNGFPIVPGICTDSPHDVIECLPKLGGFPLICKDPLGWGGRGTRVIKSQSDLIRYFHEFDNNHERSVLVEKFLYGIEISVETFACGQEVLCMPPVCKGYTDGLHAMEHVRFAPYECPGAQELAAKVVHKLGSQGPAEVEMIQTSNGLYITEINARFSGTTQISIPAAGINTYRLLVDRVRGIWKPLSDVSERSIAIQMPVLIDEEKWPGWQSDLRNISGVKRVIRQPLQRYIGRLTIEIPFHSSIEETIDLLSCFSDLTAPFQDLRDAFTCAQKARGTVARMFYFQDDVLVQEEAGIPR